MLSRCSHVGLFLTPWTVAHRTPLSMGFSRQEYYSGLTFPSLKDLPHPEIKLASLISPALAGSFFTTITTFEAPVYSSLCVCLVAQSCPTLCNPMPTLLLCPWGFSRQESWSGQRIYSPGDLPNPGTEQGSPALQVDSLPAQLLGKP